MLSALDTMGTNIPKDRASSAGKELENRNFEDKERIPGRGRSHHPAKSSIDVFNIGVFISLGL
jgi:hypothetical protein